VAVHSIHTTQSSAGQHTNSAASASPSASPMGPHRSPPSSMPRKMQLLSADFPAGPSTKPGSASAAGSTRLMPRISTASAALARPHTPSASHWKRPTPTCLVARGVAWCGVVQDDAWRLCVFAAARAAALCSRARQPGTHHTHPAEGGLDVQGAGCRTVHAALGHALRQHAAQPPPLFSSQRAASPARLELLSCTRVGNQVHARHVCGLANTRVMGCIDAQTSQVGWIRSRRHFLWCLRGGVVDGVVGGVNG
jgi:hypothetical protein